MGKLGIMMKKTMSFMLAIVLAVSLVPVMGEPIKVQAAGFLKNIYNTELGIGSINNPDAENGGGFCYVYYGSFDRDETDENPAEPVKYAVLCKDTTEYSNGNANLHTMLLDCANPLKYMQFDVEHKYSNVWKGSSVYNWMNDMDDEDSFIRKCLTDIERSAIISSYISEKDLVVGTGDGNVDQWTYDEYKHTAALTGEKVFALDVAEVSRKAYGFKPDRYYINARAKLSVDRKDLGSGYCYWWLRSPYISNDAYIGAVAGDGRILYSRNDGAGLCWASPSFNVDLSKIVLSTRISGKAGEKGAEYKLTLRDPELSIWRAMPIKYR